MKCGFGRRGLSVQVVTYSFDNCNHVDQICSRPGRLGDCQKQCHHSSISLASDKCYRVRTVCVSSWKSQRTLLHSDGVSSAGLKQGNNSVKLRNVEQNEPSREKSLLFGRPFDPEEFVSPTYGYILDSHTSPLLCIGTFKGSATSQSFCAQ